MTGKKIEENNPTALNDLYTKSKKYVLPAFQNTTQDEKQIILLVIQDKQKCHYIAVTALSAFLRGVKSKHNGDFYCINCCHSFKTKKL